jgi:lipopolysaccharide biosynthesis glycosyltransferase
MNEPVNEPASVEPVRVFVGADRSQLVAVKVLEHSIKRHTQLPVEVRPMVDLPVRVPHDPLNWQRTGFSFSRFCIPELAGYHGKALYLDADMLVFKDIASLWNLPFEGAKVIIQEELPEAHQQTNKKPGAPAKRVKQCAVMLLDCDHLTWKIDDIINGFDQGKYDYEKLMYDLCILEESAVKYAVPFHWNSMEYYEPQQTALIHYTDMATQPWVYAQNPYGHLWLAEVRLMLKEGVLKRSQLKTEIALGHFRPSLLLDLRWGHRIPKPFQPQFQKLMRLLDKPFKPHKEVYRLKKIRTNAIKTRRDAHQSAHQSASAVS